MYSSIFQLYAIPWFLTMYARKYVWVISTNVYLKWSQDMLEWFMWLVGSFFHSFSQFDWYYVYRIFFLFSLPVEDSHTHECDLYVISWPPLMRWQAYMQCSSVCFTLRVDVLHFHSFHSHTYLRHPFFFFNQSELPVTDLQSVTLTREYSSLLTVLLQTVSPKKSENLTLFKNILWIEPSFCSVYVLC